MVKRELEGIRLLLTRPHSISSGSKKKSSFLVQQLEFLGAEVFLLKALKIEEASDQFAIENAILNFEKFDWIAFTSANGVEMTAKKMREMGIPKSELMDRKLAVIGPVTGASLKRHFREPDLIASENVQESLAASFGKVKGQKFLLLRANLARDILPKMLIENGAIVEDVVAYEIVRNPSLDEFPTIPPDAIVLTSSESAIATVDALTKNGLRDWLESVPLICIGPVTADALEASGLKSTRTAKSFNAFGLVESIVDYFKEVDRSSCPID